MHQDSSFTQIHDLQIVKIPPIPSSKIVYLGSLDIKGGWCKIV